MPPSISQLETAKFKPSAQDSLAVGLENKPCPLWKALSILAIYYVFWEGPNNIGSAAFNQKSCFRDLKLISFISTLPWMTVLNLDPNEALSVLKPSSVKMPGICEGLHLNSIHLLLSPLLSAVIPLWAYLGSEYASEIQKANKKVGTQWNAGQLWGRSCSANPMATLLTEIARDPRGHPNVAAKTKHACSLTVFALSISVYIAFPTAEKLELVPVMKTEPQQ